MQADGSEAPANRWYLAYTKPRNEHIASTQLARQGYAVYVPQYKALKRTPQGMVAHHSPLFPRYVFFRPGHPAQSIAPVRSTVGVSHVVRFGITPATLSDQLVGALRSFEQQREAASLIDLSVLRAGRRVAVCAGPLKGFEGLVSAKAGTRVTVLLDMLGRETPVSLPEHQVEPLAC